MGKFCGNCGAIMDDNASVCQSCGTPFNDEGQQYGEYDNGGYGNNNSYGGYDNNNSYGGYDNNGAYGAYPQGGSTDGMTQPPLTPNQEKVKKGIIFGAIGVGAVVVMIIVITVLTSIFGGGYKKAIDNLFDGINDRDCDKLLNSISNMEQEGLEEMLNKEGMDLEDFSEEFTDVVDKYFEKEEDNREDKLGTNLKMTYEIKDVEDLSERKLKKLLEYAEEIFEDYDLDKITAAKVVTVKTKLKGSKSETKISTDELYCIKDDGEWKVYVMGIMTDEKLETYKYLKDKKITIKDFFILSGDTSFFEW